MNILVVTADDEAARSLCAALRRAGRSVRSCREVEEAREFLDRGAVRVLVVDTDLPDEAQLCALFRGCRPWGRLFVMSGRESSGRLDAEVLRKPFDAAEVAEHLAGADDLAALDHSRHALETRARDLALLVDASLEAIVGLSADGTIQSWNPGAEAIYGWSTDDICGQSVEVLEVEPGAARARLAAPDRQTAEVRRLRRDGAEVLVLLSVAPLPGGAGFAAVSLDVTQRQRLERALEHGERLAAIGKVTAAMAHEIANPLMVIRAATLRMSQIARAIDNGDLADCAADIDLAVDRISGFVQNVRGFSRRERPVLTGLPIRESVEMALRLVGPRAREREIDLQLEPGDDAVVRHDPPRLQQAVMNLVANAIDAAADGGKTVRVRIVVEGVLVRIEIEDDGLGIAPEVSARLFEAFVTTKAAGQGTGLGLSIARQIVEDHAGRVLLGPRVGGGTCAVVLLPLREKAPAP